MVDEPSAVKLTAPVAVRLRLQLRVDEMIRERQREREADAGVAALVGAGGRRRHLRRLRRVSGERAGDREIRAAADRRARGHVRERDRDLGGEGDAAAAGRGAAVGGGGHRVRVVRGQRQVLGAGERGAVRQTGGRRLVDDVQRERGADSGGAAVARLLRVRDRVARRVRPRRERDVAVDGDRSGRARRRKSCSR